MSPSLTSLGRLAVLWLLSVNMVTPTQGLTEIVIGELYIVTTPKPCELDLKINPFCSDSLLRNFSCVISMLTLTSNVMW